MKMQELYFVEIEEILKWPEWKINLLHFKNFKYDMRKELIKQKKELQQKNNREVIQLNQKNYNCEN